MKTKILVGLLFTALVAFSAPDSKVPPAISPASVSTPADGKDLQAKLDAANKEIAKLKEQLAAKDQTIQTIEAQRNRFVVQLLTIEATTPKKP